MIKSKNKKSAFNKIVAWIHLWPSIVSGIILVFVCLTGTIIVYNDEILDLTAGKAKYIDVPTTPTARITHEEILSSIKKEQPEFMVSEFVFFKDPQRSIRLRCFDKKNGTLLLVYMNPYSGKILKVDKTIHFFFVTAHLHSSLLAGKIGGWIVTISTIIFVLSTLTGLILWWPKRWTKATKQASFTIKWRAKFKRFNYDLHNVYGFYSLTICLVLGLTGLIIFFQPLMDFTIKSTGGSLEHLNKVLPKEDKSKKSLDMVDFAYQILEKSDKKEISIWNFDKQKLGVFIFSTGNVGLKSIANLDLHVVDRYSGENIQVAKSLIQHEKTENIVWQLHLGQWWGQIGKISTLLAGIIATSLPITGFIIWWGKQKKKKRKKPALKVN